MEAVIEGIVSGAVEVIATDHAPHPGSEKMQEFEKCPFGILGLETALGLSLEILVHTGRISLGALVALFTTGPARVLRLDRGTLAAGAPADITIFSTGIDWVYDVNQSFSRSRNSPFSGRQFRGGPMATIVAGSIVLAAAIGDPPRGGGGGVFCRLPGPRFLRHGQTARPSAPQKFAWDDAAADCQSGPAGIRTRAAAATNRRAG